MVHWSNKAQPTGVAEDAAAATEQSLKKLHTLVSEIGEEVQKISDDSSGEVKLDDGKLGRFLKMLSIHNVIMKYDLAVEDRSVFANVLLKTYRTCRLPSPRKSAILEAIKKILCKKFLTVPSFVLPWQELWNEALDLVTRTKSKTSEIPDSGHALPTCIAELLHTCRDYIPDSDVETVVSMAMEKLENLTQPSCVEGLLLLINCLPTAYSGYDALLPRWLEIWDRLRHNQAWDACWLTLFCRARKHCDPTNTTWSSLSTLLQVKVRSFLALPGTSSLGSHNGIFPFRFHSYYDSLIPTNKSKTPHSQVAMMKAAKIMYYFTLKVCPSSDLVLVEPIQLSQTLSTAQAEAGEDGEKIAFPGFNAAAYVRPATADLLALLQSIRPFVYPSNTGPWSNAIACLVAVMCSELSRHVGRNLVRSITTDNYSYSDDKSGEFSRAASVLRGHRVFEQSLHLGTVRFLVGTMTALSIEAVYSKSPTLQQLCSASIRNLVGLDPTLGKVVVPFLLQSLDPSAVSQSHQAPAAMTSLTSLLKPLLYPCPVILEYLPSLLELSLPGVDPNDTKKSMVTLKMYAGILAALPIRSAYACPQSATHFPPPYLSLVTCDDPDAVSSTSSFMQTYSSYTSPQYSETALASVAAAFEGWAPRLLERVFSLLDASEEPKKGSPQNGTAPLIESVIHNLFFALSEGPDTLRTSLEGMLVTYFRDTSHTNAAKACAKVAGQCTQSPGFLAKLVTALATPEVLSLQCSNDRLVCRLSALGGAARSGPGELLLPHMDVWRALSTPAFVYHSEKPIRKASVKLLKEVLRGLTSYYPILLPSSRGSTTTNAVLGCPLDRNYLVEGPPENTRPVFRWHEPSSESLAAAVELINVTAVPAMKEICTEVALLAKDSNGNGDREIKETKKRVEERVVFRLKVAQKVLRGAAEVLGDDLAPAAGAGISQEDISMDIEEEGEEGGDAAPTITPVTDAELLVHPHHEGTRTRAAERAQSSEQTAVLKGFRGDIMRLLLEVRTVLRVPPMSTVAAASAGGGEEAQGALLSASVAVHKAWAKLFTFLVVRRASTNKNMEMAKSWQSMSIQMARTMLCKTVRRGLQLVNPSISKPAAASPPILVLGGAYSQEQWRGVLSQRTYWDGHGICGDDHVRRIFIQHYARLQQWSYSSTWRALRMPSSAPHYARSPLLACLNFLTDVCCHEYDGVREAGNRAFAAVIPRYGAYVKNIIRRILIHTLSPPAPPTRTGIKYGQAAGALRLLGVPYVVGRVTKEWGLVSQFLDTVCRMPACVSALDADAAKKELITLTVVGLFVRYIGKWTHLPLPAGGINKNNENGGALSSSTSQQQTPATLVLGALGRLGFSSEVTQNSSMEVEDKANGGSASLTMGTTTTFSGGGLRFDAFNSFVVMGLLGHPDMAVPAQVWQWALQTTASAHGQPTQHIAWGALARLCALQAQGSSIITSSSLSAKLLRCVPEDRGVWSTLLPGIAAAHPKVDSDEGEAQWSGGVETVLKAANMAISPHCSFSIAFENNVVSSHFIRESAVLFMNMCTAGTIDILDKTNVSALLETAREKLAAGGTDAESRRSNATHAELYGGLLRALADSAAALNEAADTQQEQRHAEMVQVLLKHYNTSLDKLSLEYAKDWDESLLFALSGPPSDLLVPFLQSLVSSFKLAITPNPEADDNDTDEGFNREGRRMVTTAVMLRAMTTSSWQAKAPAGSPGVLSDMRKQLPLDMASSVVAAKAGVISSYRTSRSYMSGILRSLLVRGQHGGSFPADLLRGLSSTITELAEQSVPTAPSTTATTTTSSSSNNETASSSSAEEDSCKHALEIVCAMLDNISADFPVLVGVCGTSEAQKKECERCVVTLARCVVKGCGHADPEIASRSRQSATMFAESVTRGLSDTTKGSADGDVLGQFLVMLQQQQAHPSFRVRLIATECVMIVQMDKWSILSASERALVKDVFTAGFSDTVPEVMQQAQAGFAGYLSFKTPSELQKLSEAFCRNSDKYVAIDKQKKKASSSSEAPKAAVDVKFTNMVHMMCCIVLAFPYDLPPFIPPLLAATVRHAGTPALKETISRTVLEFKRTHQDRWADFKKLFSAEQLDSLSGATQVSYFS